MYVAGSTAAKPLLAEIGKLMAAQTPPATVVYYGAGSCAGVDAILSGTPIVNTTAGAFSYWDASGVEVKCDISVPSGVVAHVGISDVFASTCFQLPGGLPASVADVLGPVQAMAFVTHRSSTEQAISAEAAYYAYGFGAQSPVAPWTLEGLIFRRDELSGHAADDRRRDRRSPGTVEGHRHDVERRPGHAPRRGELSRSVDRHPVGGGRAGQPRDGQDARLPALRADAARCTRTAPKRRTTRSTCAAGGTRSGARCTCSSGSTPAGLPQNAKAGEVVGYLAGTRPAPAGLDLVKLEAQRHVIPQCAMRVRRTQEMGPAMPFAPQSACGCYYEKVATGVTTCKPCATSAECPASAPVCSYGYCEAQ